VRPRGVLHLPEQGQHRKRRELGVQPALVAEFLVELVGRKRRHPEDLHGRRRQLSRTIDLLQVAHRHLKPGQVLVRSDGHLGRISSVPRPDDLHDAPP